MARTEAEIERRRRYQREYKRLHRQRKREGSAPLPIEQMRDALRIPTRDTRFGARCFGCNARVDVDTDGNGHLLEFDTMTRRIHKCQGN